MKISPSSGAAGSSRALRFAWLFGVLVSTLSACGGGGGGSDPVASPPPAANAVAPATVRVHYQRGDGAYDGWGVYSWEGPAVLYTDWPSGDKYRFDKPDAFGRYVDIAADTSKSQMQFLINKGTDGSNVQKAPDCDLRFDFSPTLASAGQEVWVKAEECKVYDSLDAAQSISIGNAKALWLAPETIAWPGASTGSSYRLYHAAAGGIAVTPSGVTGADGFYDLTPTSGIGALGDRFRHLVGATALTLPAAASGAAKSLLRGELVVVESVNGTPRAGTQLQVQGVLDALYASAASTQALGVTWRSDGRPTFRLWAPTARNVTLRVGTMDHAMTYDDTSGVWRFIGDAAWKNAAYYAYKVEVFSRTDGGRVQTYTVTDPYALTLNADVYGGPQQRALVADLREGVTKPAGWDSATRPPARVPEDIVLYELHVRDFSANDPTVPAAQRGKYLAFTQANSNGMKHLQAMAQAGLTHVHLLPVYDITSVNEGGCTTPNVVSGGPVSEQPQATVAATKDADCFNWGYDPKHYGAPEGSYASKASDGRVRVKEFRQMVAGLNAAGLSVVMDVVYNHTAGNFLDRIVPGYYYRLNGDGNIETSTCCQNTAPEFAMMEKLMIDTLKTWAVQYRIDGFRFDIMGHIPKASMLKAKAAVDAAVGTSRKVYFYGEAWNFGEVANDRLFEQARQANLAGTGIGSFSDRIRDSLRGGGPFDQGQDMVRNQGFVSGLCYDGNAVAGATCTSGQRGDLTYRQDLIRLGLAGSLADFRLNGKLARDYDYGGQQAGYTADPQEVINYAGVHDGETLYDVSQLKNPEATSAADRARAQVVALGTVLVGQGVPFIHAGDELLRSKAFDRDSYNAGDWFNRIDWSYGTNYIDTFGLPSAEKNAGNWDLLKPFLSNPLVVPDGGDILATRNAVMDLMKVRRSSTMFRLRTGADVRRCVSFPDEASQKDGLIVMRIGTGDATCGDGTYRNVVVAINANKVAQTYDVAAVAGRTLTLHPALAAGSDPVVKGATFNAANGRVSVPARSVAVFVEN